MLRLLLPLSAALLAGCEALDSPQPPAPDDPLAAVQRSVAALESRLDSSRTLYEEIVKQLEGIRAQMALQDGRLSMAETQMADLETRLKAGPATSPPSLPSPPAPAVDQEAAIRKIQQVLGALREGKIKELEAVQDLLPHAAVAAPLLFDELRRTLPDPKYTPVLEKILGTLPSETLRTPLARALEEEGLRGPAARVIRDTGSRDLSTLLEKHLDGADEDLRVTLAEALVRCKNPAGSAHLVSLLHSEKWYIQTIAIDTLRRINRGQDFGYDPRAQAEHNRPAIERWEEWLENFGAALFEE